ncbi:MAG: hypothetical protein ACK493_15705, partial [Planctomycetota bacterium]
FGFFKTGTSQARLGLCRVGQGRGETKFIYLSIKNPGTTADSRDRRPTSSAGMIFELTRAVN